jgi:hypothetical protein
MPGSIQTPGITILDIPRVISRLIVPQLMQIVSMIFHRPARRLFCYLQDLDLKMLFYNRLSAARRWKGAVR